MTSFEDLGLADPLLRAVAAEGYTTPTPIQAAAIPAVIAGRDVLGIAQTGTGKTAAFVLPMLHQLAGCLGDAAPRSCQVLIIAPTRELVSQIGDCIRAYGRLLRPSHTVIVGGASSYNQIRAMSRGVDILVATPGRLLDHIGTGNVRLESTCAVVLDEADQMLDLGFFPAIRRIMQMLPPQRQTVLFSATMPKQIRLLADEFLNEPEEISVAPQSRPIERIEQKVILVDAAAKRHALTEILKEEGVRRSIVFTRTKHGADRVTAHLLAAGFKAEVIHGNKSQGQRERALNAFRDDRAQVLVATDIAARGIDVDGVSHVINFELPNVPESYVHRIGRTARAGADGCAISLCDPSERPFLRDIEKLIGRNLLDPSQYGRGGHRHEAAGEASAHPARRGPPRGGAKPHGHAGHGHSPHATHGAARPASGDKPAQRGHGHHADARPARADGARPEGARADGEGLSRMLGKERSGHAPRKPRRAV